MKTLLWLDDCRDPLKDDWLNFSPIGKNVDVTWVKTYQEFVDNIMIYGLPDAICFDHDLGSDVENLGYSIGLTKQQARGLKQRTLTGYDCAVWLIDYCISNDLRLPRYNIQSANPVGKKNIQCLLDNYIKRCE